MSNEKPFVRRERRFEVGDLTGFDAIVSRAGSDESVFFAELIDFSRTGVKFALPFCARFDEMLYILFEFKHSNLKYEGKGRVRHIRNIKDKCWHVGCSIDPPLTEEVISFLAKRTNQERRRYHRIEVDAVGSLVRQGTIEGCEAQIINISEGGFCLLVEKEQDPGQRVDFRIANKLGDEEKIAARVRWQKKIDGGFRIGCGYADSSSYEKLVNCLSFDESAAESEDKISWYVAAAAMLVMFLPPLSYFLFGSKGHTTDSTNNVAITAPTELIQPEDSNRRQFETDHIPPRKIVQAVKEPPQAPEPTDGFSDFSADETEESQPRNFNDDLLVQAMDSSADLVDQETTGDLAVAAGESIIPFPPFDIMNETFDLDLDSQDEVDSSADGETVREIAGPAKADQNDNVVMRPQPEMGPV